MCVWWFVIVDFPNNLWNIILTFEDLKICVNRTLILQGYLSQVTHGIGIGQSFWRSKIKKQRVGYLTPIDIINNKVPEEGTIRRYNICSCGKTTLGRSGEREKGSNSFFSEGGKRTEGKQVATTQFRFSLHLHEIRSNLSNFLISEMVR